VTTDDYGTRSMAEALRRLRVPHSPGPALFLLAPRRELGESDPLAHIWRDGNGCAAHVLVD
jgi:hypothetical protein